MALYKRFLIVFLAVMVVLVGVPGSVFANPGVSITNPQILPEDSRAKIVAFGMTPSLYAAGTKRLAPDWWRADFSCDIAIGETETITSLTVAFKQGGGKYLYLGVLLDLYGDCSVWVKMWQGATFIGNKSGELAEIHGGSIDIAINAAMISSFNEWHGGTFKMEIYETGPRYKDAAHTIGAPQPWAMWFNRIEIECPTDLWIPPEEEKDFEWYSLETDLGVTDFTGGAIDSYGIGGLSVTASADGILPVAWANWNCSPVEFRALYYPKDDPMPGLNKYVSEGYGAYFWRQALTVMLGKRGWWLLSFKNSALQLTTMVWLKLYDPSLPGDDPDSYDPVPDEEEKSFWDYVLDWFKDFWEKLLAFFADLFGPPDAEHIAMFEDMADQATGKFPFSIVAWGAGIAGSMSVQETMIPTMAFTIPAFFGVPSTQIVVPWQEWTGFFSVVRGIFTAGIWLGFAFLAITFIRKLWL